GIDVGITTYVATSDHELIPSIRAYRENLKQLKRLQRRFSKQKKGSKRRRRTAEPITIGQAIARLHEKIANTRRDMAYKTANKLLSEYDIVVHEDLQIQNMVRNPNLALSIHDMGWGILFTTLSAMAQTSATKKVIKVDPRNTSQLCSGCNEMVKKDLSERIHSCDTCGLEIDRDINASINILNRGLKLVA
ncbi:MAG TPA: transposase, partial [Limnochordia bacterium]|nr:transposase [Limnochordia bacterium]